MKLDKRKVIESEKNIINISSVTGEGVKMLLKKAFYFAYFFKDKRYKK